MLHADFCRELTLKECGREKCIPEKKICNRPKEYHLFHCVLHGRGYAEINGKRYSLKKGDIFYIKRNTSAKYAPDPTDPWTYVWVGFDGLLADETLKKCGISERNPIVRDTLYGDFRKLFELIYNQYDREGCLDFACLGYMYVLLNEMHLGSKSTEQEENSPASPKERHIAESCEYIANNFQFSVTVADIAASVGLSPNYLANIFAEKLNKSPKQYLTEYRIEKACGYLRLSDYSIQKIASMVGYPNQLHFSAEFKRITGVSPTSYRKGERSHE